MELIPSGGNVVDVCCPNLFSLADTPERTLGLIGSTVLGVIVMCRHA